MKRIERERGLKQEIVGSGGGGEEKRRVLKQKPLLKLK